MNHSSEREGDTDRQRERHEPLTLYTHTSTQQAVKFLMQDLRHDQDCSCFFLRWPRLFLFLNSKGAKANHSSRRVYKTEHYRVFHMDTCIGTTTHKTQPALQDLQNLGSCSALVHSLPFHLYCHSSTRLIIARYTNIRTLRKIIKLSKGAQKREPGRVEKEKLLLPSLAGYCVRRQS